MPCVETAGLVRAALLRDLVAPRVGRTRVAPAQNDQEGEQGGIHGPLRRSSAWQARESTSRRTAVAGHGPRPAPSAAVPRAGSHWAPLGGEPQAAPRQLSPSAPAENADVSVFRFGWKEVRFRILKIFQKAFPARPHRAISTCRFMTNSSGVPSI